GRSPSHAGASSRRPFRVPAITRMSCLPPSSRAAASLTSLSQCSVRRPADTLPRTCSIVRLRVVTDGTQPAFPPQRLTFDPQHVDQTFSVRLPLASSAPQVFARVTWQDPRGGAHDLDEIELAGDFLLVLGPYRDMMSIVAQPALELGIGCP